MTLVDRRIGLLFALFILLLGLASLRATWLGTVKAGSLKERAVQQQVEDLKVAARRGTITDRHGTELAVSEDAVSVFANPFLVKNPAATATKLAPLVGIAENKLLELLGDRDKGFVYLRRKLDADLGDKVAKLKIEGIGTVTEPRRTYPQGALAGQLLGAVGTDNYGLGGIEQEFEDSLHGTDGERKLVKDALGNHREHHRAQARRGREGPAADDRRAAPGASRGGAGSGRPRLQPQGRHGRGDGPAQWRGAGARELAARRPERLRRGVRGGAPEQGGDVELRARIDVQGVHRRRRDPGSKDHPGHPLRPPADPPGRRPRDRGGARARLREHVDGRHPRPVLQRRRRDDRAARGIAALRPFRARLRLRSQHRARPARRGARDRPASEGLLRLDAREHVDGPGPRRDAAADGRRATPRSPTAACTTART